MFWFFSSDPTLLLHLRSPTLNLPGYLLVISRLRAGLWSHASQLFQPRPVDDIALPQRPLNGGVAPVVAYSHLLNVDGRAAIGYIVWD